MKTKKPAKLKHLANWYFGTFCVKCARIDDEKENYAKDCCDKINMIVDNLIESGTEMMTHKEFRNLIKNTSTFCKPIKREFHECSICKALGVPQQDFKKVNNKLRINQYS